MATLNPSQFKISSNASSLSSNLDQFKLPTGSTVDSSAFSLPPTPPPVQSPSEKMGLSTNITGDIAKNYASTISEAVPSGLLTGDFKPGKILGDLSKVDPGKNTALQIGENALQATSDTLGVIFAPFTATAKALTDRVSSNIEQNPSIVNSPVAGHIADFVNKISQPLQSVVQKHPEAAQNIGNALNVVLTALMGEAGGEKGLKLFPKSGIDTSININPEEVVNAAGEKANKFVQGVSNAKEAVGNASEKLKGKIGLASVGKSDAEILSTPKEQVKLLNPNDQEKWYANQEKQSKSGIEAERGTKLQASTDAYNKATAATAKEAAELDRQLKVSTRDQAVKLKPEAVKLFQDKSAQFVKLQDADWEAFGGKNSKTSLSAFGKSIDANFSPEDAAKIKQFYGIEEPTTIQEQLQNAKSAGSGRLRITPPQEDSVTWNDLKTKSQEAGSISKAAQKGTQVFSQKDYLMSEAKTAFGRFIQENGGDFTKSNQFWKDWAPLRDNINKVIQPFVQTNVPNAIGTNSDALLKIISGKDVDNENFVQQFQDALGKKILPEQEQMLKNISANEAKKIAQEVQYKAEQQGIKDFTKDELDSLKDLTAQQKAATIREYNIKNAWKNVAQWMVKHPKTSLTSTIVGTILLDKGVKSVTGLGF